MKQRHHGTLQVELQGELEGAVMKALGQFSKVRQNIESMRELAVSDVAAKAMILDAAVNGVMPLRLIPHVYKHWQEPPHEEFRGRNMWSLHNAFTESFKLLTPAVGMEAGIKLGKMVEM